jgi:hypothetical protein
LLKNSYVHFAIPCYGGQISNATFKSFVALTAKSIQKGLRFTLDTLPTDSLVTRARNKLVARMMHNPRSTHLMFIDADIGFNPDDIFKLIGHDLDMVGGLYPKKELPANYVVNHVAKPRRNGDCVEVRHLGTGFMLVKRNVIERLIEASPELKITPNSGEEAPQDKFYYALFDTLIDKGGFYLSEDWTFCDMVRSKLGVSIWADISIRLDHHGQYNFAGDLESLKRNLTQQVKAKAKAVKA